MKQSAGLLVYRIRSNQVQVLLVHPGGPFWAKKDVGAWSLPKGQFEEGEDPLTAAKREFQEELGMAAPTGETSDLGTIKTPGKLLYVWAVEGDLDSKHSTSNLFEMEWPPKSGKIQQFQEADKADWFALQAAPAKLHKGQAIYIDRLAALLKAKFPDAVYTVAPDLEPALRKQSTLF